MEHGRRQTVQSDQLGLLDCALLAIRDECPPESSMYRCRMGEMSTDLESDCQGCWMTYLRYVANGRRYDPYADFRMGQ